MNSDIVFNYKNRKKRILLDYCKILEQVVTLDNNLLWKNSKEFSNICRGVLDIFVEDNYFDNNYNRDNPIEYLNACSNGILINIMDYNKKNTSISVSNKKSEIFLLSIIIGSAGYIDIISNIVDGELSNLKNKIEKLFNHLSKTNFLKINTDKVLINRLFDKMKKNINEEKRFFEYFDKLSFHNSYQTVNEYFHYYLVKFVYKLDNINKNNITIVDKYSELYKDKFLNISYDLLILLLLKENLLNKKVNTYLVQIPTVISNKQLKKLKEPAIRNYIRFLIPIEKVAEKQDIINKLKENDFKVAYYYNGNDGKILDDKSDIEVLCKTDFYNINKDKMQSWHNKNIIFVPTRIGTEINEDFILGKKEV